MSALGFSERWPRLQSEVETCEQRLVTDFEIIWGDLDALLRRALESLRSERFLSSAEPASLGSIEAFLNGSGQKLLLEVTEAVRKARPVEKALQAMERYEAAADDLLRRAPSVVSTSGTEMAEALQEDGALPVKTRLLRLLHNSRQLPFRGTLQGQLEQRLLLRSKLDGEYVRLLARACLAILGPWQDLRRDAIGALADEEAGAEGLEARQARWFNHVAELERQSAEILNRYRQWTNAIPSALAGAMASSAFITSRPGSASAGGSGSARFTIGRARSARYRPF